MHCQNCGQVNTNQSNFCRFCGTKFSLPPPPAAPPQYSNVNNYAPVPNPAPLNYENAPPRPYSWKTDEFQLPDERSAKGKPLDKVPPLPSFQTQPDAAMQPFQQSFALNQSFQCPRCNSQNIPQFRRQISTAGWIVFAILLVTFFPLFWIGLLIKEDVRVCPVCNFKYQ